MRIALITLALVALAFIWSIVYFVAGKEWLIASSPSKKTSLDTPIEIENLKYQIKTEEKLEALSKQIEALSPNSVQPKIVQSSSWTSRENIPLPVSGKFLARVMPTFEFVADTNNGIYELHTFDQSFWYSTYLDKKNAIKLLVIDTKYDTFLKNMRSVGDDVYTVNETKTFPFRSFYLNPPKPDTLVRLVIEIESQTIALEVPKTKFSVLKALLLKK